MSTQAPSLASSRAVVVAELVDQLIARVKAGESDDIEALLAEHPEHADDLRRLLPAVQMMADLSRSGDARSAHAVSGGAAHEIRGDPGAAHEVSGEPGEPGQPLGELGDFRIIREVGRGGMGVVYEAEQVSLGRRVALKVLPYAGALDAKQLQRFKNEAKAAASLRHDHIVQVHAIGCERGVHFYAMEFIDGQTLAQLIFDFRLPIDDCKAPSPAATAGWPSSIENHQSKIENEVNHQSKIENATAPVAALSTKDDHRSSSLSLSYRTIAALIADAADALDHAHSLGIVHRDVKPGNLLLDAAGKLYVSDFGLARFGPDVGLTMTGDRIGTLRYMAPEQALAKHSLVDHRADVYSLGATLYELLSGRPAVDGEDKQEILSRIAFAEPTSPRKHDRAIPAELETISLKCLAKEPGERYATAGEMAADLTRWMEDKPISARRRTTRQRFVRWARRHPGLVAALGIAVGLLLAGIWALDQEVKRAESAALSVAAEADQLRAANRLPEALAVARRASDLLPAFGGSAAVRQAVQERLADLQLLDRLLDVRLAQANTSGVTAISASDTRKKAYQEFDVDLFGEDETAVIETLRRRMTAPEIALMFGHDRFQFSGLPTQAKWERLVAALDDDPLQIRSRYMRLRHFEFGEWLTKEYVAAAREICADAEKDISRALFLTDEADNLVNGGCNLEMLRLLRAMQHRYPADFFVNYKLANVLSNTIPAQTDEAIRFYTAALALRPNSLLATYPLGYMFRAAGRNAEAAAVARQLVALAPNDSTAYELLATALFSDGRFAEAEFELRQAFSVGQGFSSKRRLSPHLLMDLGKFLVRCGRLTEAEEFYRRGIRAAEEKDPNDFLREAYLGLSEVLQLQGRYSEAAAILRRDLGLGNRWPGDAWIWPYNQRLRDVERMAALAPRLPALIVGEIQPVDANEMLTLGLIFEKKSRFAAAARFFANAFAADPALEVDGEQTRYVAAKAAANAGCGQGDDASSLPDVERSRLRKTALKWLAADLAARAKRDIPRSNSLSSLTVATRHWGWSLDLACVRDAAYLAKLPEAEHTEWLAFWADVNELALRKCYLTTPRNLRALLDGKRQPADAADQIAIASYYVKFKTNTAGAARAYSAAFAADPKLAENLDSHRYNAACAASLAGCGTGADVKELNDVERGRLRGRALGWLTAELVGWTKLADRSDVRPNVRRVMRHWHNDIDLAGVRGDAIEMLPQVERTAWRKLWADVAALLKTIGDAEPQTPATKP